MINRHASFCAVLLAGLFIILFCVVAWLFSFQQNLWVDETTQLSGLTLSVIDVYRWLSGLIETPFVVPSDRMPVLSYWFGMLWSELFSADLLVMRWASLFIVATSFLCLAYYFISRRQPSILLVSLLFLSLSPNLTILAVEVRAYALFFLFSVLAILLYIEVLSHIERQQSVFLSMLALSFVLALAINTHFFGVVLAGSLLGAYLLMAFFDRRFVLNARLIISVGTVVLLGVAFIVLPVITAFTSQGGSVTSVPSDSVSEAVIRPAIKLIYRLVAHQSMGEVMLLTPVALAVVYGVIAFSVIKYPTTIKTTLALVLALGVTVLFVANILLSRFDALAPHYNIWMLPIVAILFAHSINDIFINKIMPKIVLLSLLTVSCGYGQWTLAVSGEKYAHTRFSEIERRVDTYSPQARVTVVYNKAMAKTWFAGLYTFPVSVRQLIVKPAEGYQDGYPRAQVPSYVDLRTGKSITVKDVEQLSDVLISVYGENIYSAELNASAPQKALPKDHPAFDQLTLSSSRWQQIEAMSYLAQESASIVVYKKTP